MMHETIQATSAPCPWGNGTVGKAFGENALTTTNGFAAKAADTGLQLY